MKEIKIKSETTAKRCEICHLEDQFDPEKNICNRCVNVVVPKNKEATDLGSKYKGIWGWISLFWINTTFFNPMGATWQVISDYRDYSEYFETYPSVFACCVSTNILSVAIASLGVYVGVGLIKLRPNVINLTKKYLIIAFFTLLVMDFITIFTFSEIIEETKMRFWIIYIFFELCLAFIYCVGWYAYFCKSRRVLATYRAKEAE